ncbi:fimbria/pilus outer membrane usher protein [Erwinia sp. CGal63]|uniref:fimbria/pilus outer membrane usher protein n=1 Tax=Erwinia sp. CGal63 TaxID=2919889 RepID=UPI00300A52CE
MANPAASLFVSAGGPVASYRELQPNSREQIQLAEPPLSHDDWQWLRHKRTLRYGFAALEYAPYDLIIGYRDYDGLDADYLALLAFNLNIPIAIHVYPNKAQLLTPLRQGDIDLIGRASLQEAKENDLLLTRPYFSTMPALVERTDSQPDTAKRVAIGPLFHTRKSLAGSAVLHQDGVTFGQTLGETVALVEVPETGGIGVINQYGTTTDARGFAVIGNLTPYRVNELMLDSFSLQDERTLPNAETEVVPTAGAIMYSRFKPPVAAE